MTIWQDRSPEAVAEWEAEHGAIPAHLADASPLQRPPGPRYVVLCHRSGDWWAIEVPSVPGVHSQARTLDEVPAMAKDAIGLLLGVPPDLVLLRRLMVTF